MKADGTTWHFIQKSRHVSARTRIQYEAVLSNRTEPNRTEYVLPGNNGLCGRGVYEGASSRFSAMSP